MHKRSESDCPTRGDEHPLLQQQGGEHLSGKLTTKLSGTLSGKLSAKLSGKRSSVRWQGSFWRSTAPSTGSHGLVILGQGTTAQPLLLCELSTEEREQSERQRRGREGKVMTRWRGVDLTF